MLKTIFILVVLLLGINALLAWQNLRTELGTDESCRLLTCAKKTKDDSGGLMLPASSVLFKSINLFN